MEVQEKIDIILTSFEMDVNELYDVFYNWDLTSSQKDQIFIRLQKAMASLVKMAADRLYDSR